MSRTINGKTTAIILNNSKLPPLNRDLDFPFTFIALEDALGQRVVHGIAEGTGLGAHFTKDALISIPIHNAITGCTMHGTGWAHADTGSVAALLAHHRYRYAFPLPGKDVDTSPCRTKVLFVGE